MKINRQDFHNIEKISKNIPLTKYIIPAEKQRHFLRFPIFKNKINISPEK